MQIATSVSLFLACTVVAAGTVSAQDAADLRSPSAPGRGYVSASAGTTVSTPEASPAFAVEYAEQIGRFAQGYAALSYFDDLVTGATRDDLRGLGATLTALTGEPWEFDARDRGIAFIAGGKFLVPTGTSVRPYVGGGAGAIKVTRTITERFRGDLTDAVIREGLTDGSFNVVNSSATKPIVEGIVGVGIGLGHTHVDIGYRYRKAFHFAAPLDFGQFSVGVGYRF